MVIENCYVAYVDYLIMNVCAESMAKNSIFEVEINPVRLNGACLSIDCFNLRKHFTSQCNGIKLLCHVNSHTICSILHRYKVISIQYYTTLVNITITFCYVLN